MNRKLIITKIEEKIITAVLEDEKVAELHISKSEEQDTVQLGNIYVGRVKNIVANINAAFIEVAPGVECYYAISENPTPIFTKKIGKKPLCIGDEVLVQISKEAVKTKVPTVTSKLNITGKYAVLTYGDTRVGASTKLSKTEKVRLIEVAKEYASTEFGIIMRTNAKDAEPELLSPSPQADSPQQTAIIPAQNDVINLFFLIFDLLFYFINTNSSNSNSGLLSK